MPRNSSGTYTLPSGNPVVSGTLIEASWANTTLADLASAMTNSLSRGGEGGMTAALRLFDGTVSLPGLAFTSETSTGLYRAGTGDLRLSVTGSQVMQFLTTGVAVTGTLSATGAVSLTGQTTTLENSTAYYPQLINRNKTADANASYISLQKIRGSSIVQNGDVLGNVIFSGYDGAAYLQGAYINAIVSATPGTNDMPADLVFGTTPDGGAGPSERMRLDKSGNLGLGVTPSAWDSSIKAVEQAGGTLWSYTTTEFHSTANAYFDGAWKYKTTYPASDYQQGNGIHIWKTAASGSAGSSLTWTQAMTLDASGNLGVGTTSPYAKIQAAGTIKVATGNAQGILALGDGNGSTVNCGVWRGAANAPTSDGNYLNFGGYDGLVFATGNAAIGSQTERARIDSSGNLLVGTATVTGSGYVQLTNTASKYSIAFRASASTGAACAFFNSSGGGVGEILTGASSTTYSTSSDYRLKHDVAPMTGALAKVAALKPVTYKWNIDGSDGEGFIAHELAEVVPDCVIGEKDGTRMEQYEITPAVPATYDEEGNELTPAVEAVMGEREVPAYQGIDTSFLVATLTAAIQEQQAIIEGLTARISALETTP